MLCLLFFFLCIDPHKQRDDREVALVRDNPPGRTTTAKMVNLVQ